MRDAPFLGREAEQQRFRDILRDPERALRLQFVYGIGGEGKTSLLRRFSELCAERDIPWARADLAETSDAGAAITVLAAQLSDSRLSLPRTKKTLFALAAKKRGDTSASSSEAIRHGSAIIGVSLDTLGLIPPLSFVAAAAKVGHTALTTGVRHAMKTPKYRDVLLKLGGEEELVELLSRDVQDLTTELVVAFARDLAVAGENSPHPGPFVVLLFDRHEALWRDAAGGASSRDAWVRQLYRETFGSNTLIVLAGRDALDEVSWAGAGLPVDSWRLEGITRNQAAQLIVNLSGSALPKPLEDAVLELTSTGARNGTTLHHCYLLALCGGIIENSLRRTGQPPNEAAFAEIPRGDLAADALASTLLESLNNQAMASWLEELSALPFFDEDYALALDRDRNFYVGRTGWQRLMQFSFVEPLGGGRYQLHALFQRSLAQRVSEEHRRAVLRWAATYFSAKHVSADSDLLLWLCQRSEDQVAARARAVEARETALESGNVQRLLDLERWWTYASPKPMATLEDGMDALEHATLLQALGRASDPAGVEWAIALVKEAIPWLGSDDEPDARYLLARCFVVAGRVSEARAELAWVLANSGDSVARWRRAKLLFAVTFLEGPERFSGGAATQQRELEELLQTYGPNDRDRVWALAHNNLAVSWIRRFDASSDQRDLSPAVDHLRSARTFFGDGHHLLDWALASLNLAETLCSLDGASLLEAKQAAKSAASVYVRDVFPELWARCQQAVVQCSLGGPVPPGADELRDLIGQLDTALSVVSQARHADTRAELLCTKARCWRALVAADATAAGHAEGALAEVLAFADTGSPVRQRALKELETLRERTARASG